MSYRTGAAHGGAVIARASKLEGRGGVRRHVGEAPELSWRLIRDGARTGSANMALDHALALSAAERGEGVVRLYRWSSPTVSFGRNEPAVGLYSVEAARERGIRFVRRPTGGRAVLHSDEQTYSVAVPIRRLGGARALYGRINRALTAALGSLGVTTALSDEAVTPGLDAGPCFEGPAKGEVMAGGRKLVGSAQARLGGALLQHGSILVSDDQGALATLYRGGRAARPPALLDDLVDGLDADALQGAVAEGLREEMGGEWRHDAPDLEELEVMRRLERERYRAKSWTWRR